MSNVRITGTLGRDAEPRTSPDGTAWVCVEVHQGSGSLAVSARRRFGQGPAAQLAAHNAARHLRAGARVTLHAAAFDIATGPSPHLVLLGVDHIERLAPFERAWQEPSEREASTA